MCFADFEPDHALTQSLPNWESNVTMFAPRADLDMRVSRPKKTDDTEDASNNGEKITLSSVVETLFFKKRESHLLWLHGMFSCRVCRSSSANLLLVLNT